MIAIGPARTEKSWTPDQARGDERLLVENDLALPLQLTPVRQNVTQVRHTQYKRRAAHVLRAVNRKDDTADDHVAPHPQSPQTDPDGGGRPWRADDSRRGCDGAANREPARLYP
jgi:hypothetical protein